MGAVPDKIQTWQMVQPYAKNRETGETVEGRIDFGV